MTAPHFKIKNYFQKQKIRYQDLLTPVILEDICMKITGQKKYTCDFDDTGINVGRLATLEYDGKISYISFSENNIRSRNSSFQSFPSALIRYHEEANAEKRLYFYFLRSSGNYETSYFRFMYRLMKTAKVEFLNEDVHLSYKIAPYTAVDSIIEKRNQLRLRNPGNNSTYITRDINNTIQIYGKTYGASKYETTLLSLASNEIDTDGIEVYQMVERNLIELPKKAKEVLNSLANVKLITTNEVLERHSFVKNNSLRSPTYNYNLWKKLGIKKCTLCGCEIPQIIEGAHIWPVAEIKKMNSLSFEKKLKYATDGENGIWLCQNHHKLLDSNILRIHKDGQIRYRAPLNSSNEKFLKKTTQTDQLANDILTPEFLGYLKQRNRLSKWSVYKALR